MQIFQRKSRGDGDLAFEGRGLPHEAGYTHGLVWGTAINRPLL